MIQNNRLHDSWFDSPKLNLPTEFAPNELMLPPPYRSSLTSEEIRQHAELHRRLMALRHKRSGVWSRIWRFVWGN
jgi:hypothetical protein